MSIENATPSALLGSSAAVLASAISPVVFTATIKLPGFWQHDQDPWFQHIEAQFNLCRITVDETEYYHEIGLIGFLYHPPCNWFAEGPTGKWQV